MKLTMQRVSGALVAGQESKLLGQMVKLISEFDGCSPHPHRVPSDSALLMCRSMCKASVAKQVDRKLRQPQSPETPL